MDSRVLWLWLQHALGAGSRKHPLILEKFGDLETFWNAGPAVWNEQAYLTPKMRRALKTFTLDDAQGLLEYAEKLGQQILTPDMPAYPEKLRVLPDYPCALFIKGQMPPVDYLLTVAMVGTRKATYDGLHAARRFAREIAKAGAIIVSGGALGVDTQAHLGALDADAYTVCVLGCGLEQEYLMANADLRARIARFGALISEYPPGTVAMGSNFPIRNRIISGLSVAVVVVEAAQKSGSLITAHCALDQGRDVFAIPGSVENRNACGTNALLSDGAIPASTPDDVLRYYETRYQLRVPMQPQVSPPSRTAAAPKPEKRPGKPAKPAVDLSQFSDAAKTLYEALDGDKTVTMDKLCADTGLPVYKLLAAATELELMGLIEGASGQRYRRKGK